MSALNQSEDRHTREYVIRSEEWSKILEGRRHRMMMADVDGGSDGGRVGREGVQGHCGVCGGRPDRGGRGRKVREVK